MPTGYTAPIYEGKPITFPQFAMNCARAFGALIMMRDDPMDAPIPEKFKPESFYAESIKGLEAELAAAQAWFEEEAEAAARAFYDKAIDEWNNSRIERAARRLRYEEMLAEVRKYVPPSPDHIKFKEFMVEQLETSIDHDCYEYGAAPKRVSGAYFQAHEIKRLTKSLAYYKKAEQEEIDRVERRNTWIHLLRQSLTA